MDLQVHSPVTWSKSINFRFSQLWNESNRTHSICAFAFYDFKFKVFKKFKTVRTTNRDKLWGHEYVISQEKRHEHMENPVTKTYANNNVKKLWEDFIVRLTAKWAA